MGSLSPEQLGRMFAERWNDADGRTQFLGWRERLTQEEWEVARAAYEKRALELLDARYLDNPELVESLAQMREMQQKEQADEVEAAEADLFRRIGDTP